MTDKHIGSNFDDFLKDEGILNDQLLTGRELGFFEKDINVPSKEIIIDGVDVSGCQHIDNDCFNCEIFAEICGNNPNCNYKQYKRKEQECERLQGVIRKDICSHYVLGECSKEHHNNCVGKNQCIKDLEQEVEELKIYIESNEQQVKEVETLVMDNDRLINELDQLKAENEELKKCYKNNLALLDKQNTNTTKLINKVMKLEQALQEIKELLLKTATDSRERCVNAKSVILQKCEVLDD